MSLLEMSPVLLCFAGALVYRIHLRRIRKNQEKIFISLSDQKGSIGDKLDMESFIKNWCKMLEIQEQNLLDYYVLTILAVLILFTQH